MSNNRSRALVALLALAALACGKGDAVPPPPPAPAINAVLPNVPTPPEGVALASESGADATQLVFVTPIKPDSLISYYRTKLAEPPFRLLSEQKVKETTVFVAEQDGPGLWVTVKSDSAGGSSVVIAGGVNPPAPKDTMPRRPIKP